MGRGGDSVWVRSAEVSRKKLQKTPLELSAAEANVVMRIARFALVACHELRTPLTSTLASLGMLQDLLRPAEGSMEDRLISNALRSARTLKAHTDDLQDIVNFVAGIGSIQRGVVDIATVIRNVATRLEKQAACAKVELRLDIEDGLPPLSADSYRLEQVVSNPWRTP